MSAYMQTENLANSLCLFQNIIILGPLCAAMCVLYSRQWMMSTANRQQYRRSDMPCRGALRRDPLEH